MSDQWYYGENGQQRGPISLATLRERLVRGQTRGEDLVWREGMTDWATAASQSELADAIPTRQPEVITPAMQAPPPMHPQGPQHAPPYYPGYAHSSSVEAMMAQRKANNALIMGICSIVFAGCCGPIGIILGVLAVVNGRGTGQMPNAGSATAGVVCGWIGIALASLNMLAGVAMVPSFLSHMQQVQMHSTTYRTQP